ncbi:myb-binding protein 1A-like protein [Ciona intestinalis]
MAGKPDSGYLSLFWDLGNNNEEARNKVAQKLVQQILSKQNENEELCEDASYVLGRLVKGLSSNRKSARVGFATALTNLLLMIPSSVFDSNQLMQLMEEKLKIQGNNKSEDKEVYLGRVFCLLSLIQSKKLTDENSTESLKETVTQLVKLSETKHFLRSITYHGLTEVAAQVSRESFKNSVWPLISDRFDNGWESCTPEILYLLETCAKLHPKICNKEYLKTNKWIPQKSKKGQIIGEHCFKHLARIVAETTSCHPNINPFALSIISSVGKLGSKSLGKLWSEHLSTTLLSSSPERKYLSIKLAIHSLSCLEVDQLSEVWSKDLLMHLYHALLNKDNPLHLICKNELPKYLGEKLNQQDVSWGVQYNLLFRLFSSPGGIHLDSITHTSIIYSIVSHFKLPALLKYITWLKQLFLYGTRGDVGIQDINLDVARRWSSSQLSHLVRMQSLPREEEWIGSIIKFLFVHSHFIVTVENSTSSVLEDGSIKADFIELSQATQSHIQQCFTNVLSWLNNMLPLVYDKTNTEEKKPSVPRIPGTMNSGNFWLTFITKYADQTLLDKSMKPVFQLDDQLQQIWTKTMDYVARLTKLKSQGTRSSKSSEATALQLLLLHVGLQLISFNPQVQASAVDVLEDLQVIVDERFFKKSKKADADQPHWVDVIVEILLTMLSQGSHSVRIVAEQVFRLINPHLTPSSLKLMLDVLKLKSEELMKDDEDGDGEDEEGDEEDNEEEAQKKSDSESSEEDSDDESDEEDAVDVDEEFKKRIKEALGDAAAPSEESDANDEDESEDEDFSDDAMMRIDPLLSDIFKQRKLSRKATKKNNRMQVTHFQLRCLDLLETFITRQCTTNPLVLDLLLPLLDVVESSTKDPEKEILAERATVVLRIKLCKMKGYPHSLDDDVIGRCHDNIAKALKKCYSASGGVFLSQLASHCCMLYLRVLSGNPGKDSKSSSGAVDVDRVCSLYSSALEDFMTKRESRIQACVIQDFISRYPNYAQGLIQPLTTMVADGIQLYRKTQACLMLSSYYQASPVPQSIKESSGEILTAITNIISTVVDDKDSLKGKYMVALIKLLFQCISSLKSTNSDFKSAPIVQHLQNFLKIEEVKRSQELNNLTWKILNVFGLVSQSGKIIGDKRSRKRKNKKKNKEANRDAENIENEGGMNNGEESKESRKQLKARHLKEKKKLTKASKQKRSKKSEKQEKEIKVEN